MEEGSWGVPKEDSGGVVEGTGPCRSRPVTQGVVVASLRSALPQYSIASAPASALLPPLILRTSVWVPYVRLYGGVDCKARDIGGSPHCI